MAFDSLQAPHKLTTCNEMSCTEGSNVFLSAPEVRGASLSTVIIADGFSCREQISQSTNRHALHLAEVMHMAQETGSSNELYPERKIVERRRAGLRRARGRTLATLVGVALLGLLLGKALRKRH